MRIINIMLKKVKKNCNFFDLINEKFNETFYRKKLKYQKKILDIADKIICISNNTKNDLLNFYNVDRKNLSYTFGISKKKTYLKKYLIFRTFYL